MALTWVFVVGLSKENLDFSTYFSITIFVVQLAWVSDMSFLPDILLTRPVSGSWSRVYVLDFFFH